MTVPVSLSLTLPSLPGFQALHLILPANGFDSNGKRLALPCPALPTCSLPQHSPHRPCQGHPKSRQPESVSLLFDSLPSGTWTQTQQVLSSQQAPARDVPLVMTSHP